MTYAHTEAARAGQNKYYTGYPCKRGHITYRYTCSGYCCECNKEDTRRYRSARGLSGRDVPPEWNGPRDIHIETRRQAFRAGRSKYYTGKPCKRGHSAPRYVSSGVCCECHAETARARRERLIGPALMSVTVRVPGNQAQALRDYAGLLREMKII